MWLVTNLNSTKFGKITSVDISPIYEMESYPEEEGLDFFIKTANSEEEKQKIIKKAKEGKANLQGNIDKVLRTITELIENLTLLTIFHIYF